MPKGKRQQRGLPQPDDKFFKEAMSQLDIAADYFKNFLPPPIVKKIHFESLRIAKDSFITQELQPFFSDLIYTCKYGVNEQPITVSLLFEHKSSPDPYARLQLLRYMLNIWETQRKGKQPLTPVIPILFYHGQQPWLKQPFSSLFKGIDEYLRSFLPESDYCLTDLNDYSLENIQRIQAGFIVNTLLAFKLRYDEASIKSQFHLLLKSPRGVTDQNFIVTIFVYLMSVTNFEEKDLADVLAQIPDNIKPLVMTTYDRIVAHGLEKGIVQGLEKGLELKTIQAIRNMHNEGFDDTTIARVLEVDPAFVRHILDSKPDEKNGE